MFFPSGEYLGTTEKLGPLAKSEICASVSGLDDKFLTHLALILSGDSETGLGDVVAASFVALLELDDDLEVVGLKQSLLVVYMYPSNLPPLLPLPLLLFGSPPVVLCHNLLNLAF